MADAVNTSGPSPAAWAALEARHGATYLIRRTTVAEAARIVWGPAYLATPYTRLVTDDAGRFVLSWSANAAEVAALVAQKLATHGVSAWSPIVQAHAMVQAGVSASAGLALDPLAAGFWENWCRPWLDQAAVVIVPDLVGWQDSAGVWHEVHSQLARQRPVLLLETAGWLA